MGSEKNFLTAWLIFTVQCFMAAVFLEEKAGLLSQRARCGTMHCSPVNTKPGRSALLSFVTRNVIHTTDIHAFREGWKNPLRPSSPAPTHPTMLTACIPQCHFSMVPRARGPAACSHRYPQAGWAFFCLLTLGYPTDTPIGVFHRRHPVLFSQNHRASQAERAPYGSLNPTPGPTQRHSNPNPMSESSAQMLFELQNNVSKIRSHSA